MVVFIIRAGVKDRSRPGSLDTAALLLTTLKSTILDTIIKAFIRGIMDEDIKILILKGLVSAERSLLTVFIVAEEAARAKIELKKLQNEKLRYRDLQFYKNVVQRNMPSQQIKTILAFYHA